MKEPERNRRRAGRTCQRRRAIAPQIIIPVKKLGSLLLCAGLVALSGCARHYVLTLQNGTQISAKNKPHLVNGHYVFKDALGQDASVPAGRVTEVSPASMMSKGPSDKR